MGSEKYHNSNTLEMAQDGREEIETVFSSGAELRNKDSSETVLNAARDRVAYWTEQWLEDLYEKPPQEADGFFYDNALKKKLISLSEGVDVEKVKGDDYFLITPLYRMAVETFYKELVNFAEQRISENKEPKKTQEFIQTVNGLYFSMFGGTTDHMGFTHHLLFTAKTNRVPELQGLFGQQFTEEMVYKLSFCRDTVVDKLIDEIKERPVAELIDIIEQLKTIAAHAMVNVYSEEEGYNNAVKIIIALKDNSKSPLVIYSAEAALVRLEQEQKEPTYGMVTTHAAATDARLPERLSKQYRQGDKELSKQIKANFSIQRGSIFVRISKDTVGILDHSNMLYAVGKVEAGELKQTAKVSPQAIENIKNFLQHEKNPYSEKLRELLGVTIQRVLAPREGKKFIPVKDLPEIFYKISSVLTVEEYRELFSQIVAREKWEDEQGKYQSQITKEAEEKNLEISDHFLQEFLFLAERLAREKGKDFSWIHDKLEEFKVFMQQENMELAMKTAMKFCSRFDFFLRIKIEKEEDNSLDNIALTQTQIAQTRPNWSPKQVNLVYGLIKARQNMNESHSNIWKEWEEKKNNHFNDSSITERMAQITAYSSAIRHFGKHFAQFSSHLSRFLKQIEEEQSRQLVPVHFIRVQELAKDKTLMPFATKDEQEMPILLADLHRPALRKRVEQDLGISLSDLTLSSQIHFLRFLAGRDQTEYKKLIGILKKGKGFSKEILNSFLVVSENVRYGNSLLNIAETLEKNPDLARKVFSTYNNFVEKARKSANKVQEQLGRNYFESELNEQDIIQAILMRAKDFVVELEEALKSDSNFESCVNQFISELNKESTGESIIRGQFKAIALLLERDDIDLRGLEQQQQTVLNSLMSGKNKGLTYRVLSRMGKLEPVPEIHWKVDRTSEEYNRRFGINLNGLLAERAGKHLGSQNLLEIGPGSGVAKKERAGTGLRLRYNDFALSDKIYYPLAGVIEKLVDFSKLEKEIGEEITEEDRKVFADYIYKVIVIKQGQTSGDNFEYNTKFQAKISRDINALKEVVPELGKRLQMAEVVPSNISSRNEEGQVFYPNKIKTEKQSQVFQKVKAAFQRDPEQFLAEGYKDKDLYELIEAFPANTMIGDMSEIKRLKSGQVDVEIASRSTLYKYGNEYIKFLVELERVLAKDGMAIDDSIRDNDGWYYRLAEVFKAQEQAREKLEVLVVIGSGFPGEDYRQEGVPLAMILTKQGSLEELAKKHLLPGNRLVKLEELIQDEEYLKSLDTTGWTAEQATKAAGKLSKVA